MLEQCGKGNDRQERLRRDFEPLSGRVALFFVIVLSILFTDTTATFAQRAEEPAAPHVSAACPPAPVKSVKPEDGKEINTIAGLSDGRISPAASLYIFAVGINEYKNPKLRLKYGRSDAEAFVQAVEQHGKNTFRQIVKLAVYDAYATRETLEAVFDKISAETRPEDVFVFYYAGHGVMSEEEVNRKPEFYLALTDVTRLRGDNKLLEERGFSARQLRDHIMKVRAQKQLVVLDTCHAGGALESFSMHETTEGRTAPQLAKNAGITVLAAASASESATEFRQLGHGVFTYALLKGLAGDADTAASPDGRITVKELEAYLNAKVPEFIKQFKGKAQNPNSFARGQDFPLGAR